MAMVTTMLAVLLVVLAIAESVLLYYAATSPAVVWTVAAGVVGLTMGGLGRVVAVLPSRMLGGSPDGPPLASTSQSQSRGPRSALVVLGSGGHTTEMLRLLGALNLQSYTPRTYVYAETDRMSPTKLAAFERNRVDYVTRVIPRAREVRQGAVGTIFGSARALAAAVPMVLRGMPDLVLTNGPGTCIPLCIAAYIPRLLGMKRIQIVYVESICRVTTLSMTGKLLYPFCDGFIVQWPELAAKYPEASYLGRLC
mmetsp:Transcript_31429/g.82430  ORF Transcript_31429/g.82430 Transcript_31429/m.82430 type:complete len:253 (+) Transcript_31429:433-1191(+)